MRRVHVVGARDSGKTKLIVEVVEELRLRSLRVGTIKHTPHLKVLDRPGSDSYRHRAAGAEPSAIITPDASAIYQRTSRLDAYAALENEFEKCDVVIVEGDDDARAPKIEIWSAQGDAPPLATRDEYVLAIVCDSPTHAAQLVSEHVAVLARGNVPAIADVVMVLARRAST